jgi:hypothetical protein
MTLGLTTGGGGGGSTTSTTTTSTTSSGSSTVSPSVNLIITTTSYGSGTAITVPNDTSGVALQISLSDFPNPTSYSIWSASSEGLSIITSGSWSTSNSTMTIPITGLVQGTFDMFAKVSSTTSSITSNTVTLSVAPSVTTTITTTTSTTTTSTSSPTANLIITTVSNGSGTAVTVTTDTSGVALQISLSDFPNPTSYSIWSVSSEGSSIITSHSWSTTSSILTIPITSLVQGTFTMFARVSSTTSSITSNPVTLTVVPSVLVPNVNLIITTVSNGSGTAIAVTTDTSGVALQISLSAFPNPTSYSIQLPLDNTTITSGSWSTTSSTMTIPITGLAEGIFQIIAQVSSNTMSLDSNPVTLAVAPSVTTTITTTTSTTTITTTTGTLFPVLEKIAIGAGIASVIGVGIATYFLTRKK